MGAPIKVENEVLVVMYHFVSPVVQSAGLLHLWNGSSTVWALGT